MASKFESRTDAKLRYARLHLDEILSRNSLWLAEEFDRAHQESVLFHVVGAKDSFLQEINEAHKPSLLPHRVSEANLRRSLRKRGLQSQALESLLQLEGDTHSWLAVAIELRNQGTHRFSITRKYYMGGEFDGQVFFMDSRTGERVEMNIRSFLTDCIEKMTLLVRELRATLAVDFLG